MNRTTVGIGLLIMWLIVLLGLVRVRTDIRQLATCHNVLKQEIVDQCIYQIARAVEDGVKMEALKEAKDGP